MKGNNDFCQSNTSNSNSKSNSCVNENNLNVTEKLNWKEEAKSISSVFQENGASIK